MIDPKKGDAYIEDIKKKRILQEKHACIPDAVHPQNSLESLKNSESPRIFWLVAWNHGILWLSIQLGNVIIPIDFNIFQRG